LPELRFSQVTDASTITDCGGDWRSDIDYAGRNDWRYVSYKYPQQVEAWRYMEDEDERTY